MQYQVSISAVLKTMYTKGSLSSNKGETVISQIAIILRALFQTLRGILAFIPTRYRTVSSTAYILGGFGLRVKEHPLNFACAGFLLRSLNLSYHNRGLYPEGNPLIDP